MRLRVRVANPMYARKHIYASYMHIPEYNDYEGEIYPNPKWVKDNAFCLTTTDPQFPFRIIEKSQIICGWRLPKSSASQVDAKQVSIIVPGKKSTHIVTSDGISHSCDCIGYSYRKTCSHIQEIENELQAA